MSDFPACALTYDSLYNSSFEIKSLYITQFSFASFSLHRSHRKMSYSKSSKREMTYSKSSKRQRETSYSKSSKREMKLFFVYIYGTRNEHREGEEVNCMIVLSTAHVRCEGRTNVVVLFEKEQRRNSGRAESNDVSWAQTNRQVIAIDEDCAVIVAVIGGRSAAN